MPFEFLAVASLIFSIGVISWLGFHFFADYQAHRSIDGVVANLDKKRDDAVSLTELARFEEELPPGSAVIVLAHTIENPQEALRAAVQDSFQQGIRYIFLVSQSQYGAKHRVS